MSWLSRLVERRILASRAKGELEGLEGEGKPLPDRPGDAFADPGLAAGFRIMAEAGALPEEIRLKKRIEAARAGLAGMTDPAARRAAEREIADLTMRLAMAEEARRKFLRD